MATAAHVVMEMMNTSSVNDSGYDLVTSPPGSVTPGGGPTLDYPGVRRLYVGLMGSVIPCGLLCNVVALLVFSLSPPLRSTVTGSYLISLALADTVFLLGDFFRWLNPTTSDVSFGLDVMHETRAFCQGTHYVRYLGKFASAWITVGVASQRFLLVVKPLKAAIWCTTSRVRLLVLVIFVLAAGLNSFPFWTIDIVTHRNRTLCGYSSYAAYNAWFTAVVRCGALLVPGALILLLTAVIVYDLSRAGRRRQRHLDVGGQQAGVSSALAMELRLSVMLVIVAVSFLLMRTPYAIAYFLNDNKKALWSDLDPLTSFRIYQAFKFTDVVATSNYVVNFFLYCLCGSTFRRHLLALARCRPATPGLGRQRGKSSLRSSSSRKTESFTFRFRSLRNGSATTNM